MAEALQAEVDIDTHKAYQNLSALLSALENGRASLGVLSGAIN
jgi:hypothetical protein